MNEKKNDIVSELHGEINKELEELQESSEDRNVKKTQELVRQFTTHQSNFDKKLQK